MKCIQAFKFTYCWLQHRLQHFLKRLCHKAGKWKTLKKNKRSADVLNYSLPAHTTLHAQSAGTIIFTLLLPPQVIPCFAYFLSSKPGGNSINPVPGALCATWGSWWPSHSHLAVKPQPRSPSARPLAAVACWQRGVAATQLFPPPSHSRFPMVKQKKAQTRA